MSLLHQQLARIGHALAAPARIAILELLAQAPRTVERIASDAKLSVANASQHLRVLREARLVEREKRGLFVTYRVAAPQVAETMVALRDLGETQLAELREAREAIGARAGDVVEIDRETLMSRMKTGDAIVIDVRPVEEYEAGHLDGAVSIPLKELESRLDELPRTSEIVAYCRGPYCLLSIDAVRILAKKGRRAKRLEDGVVEWRAAGLRVAEGPAAAGVTRTRRRRSGA